MTQGEVLLAGGVPNLLWSRIRLLATAGIHARALTVHDALSQQYAVGACLLLILCHSIRQDEVQQIAEQAHKACDCSCVTWMRMSTFSPKAPAGVDETLGCMPSEFIRGIRRLRQTYCTLPPGTAGYDLNDAARPGSNGVDDV